MTRRPPSSPLFPSTPLSRSLVVPADREAVPVARDDPHVELGIGELDPGGDRRRPPVDRVEPVRREVIGEPGRAADARNEDGALAPGAEVRQGLLDRLEDRIVPAPGAPPNLLVRRVVLGGELRVGDRGDRHRLDLTPWPRSLARSPPL